MVLPSEILFWISSAAIAQTYIIFPIYTSTVGKTKKNNSICFNENELPEVSIIIPAHNEEKVIHQKINSLLNSDYDINKLEILIGSDNSTDQTNDIVRKLGSIYPRIKLIEFNSRTGKPGILNQLVPIAKNEIIILTDADVEFSPTAIKELVKHFKNESIGLVDSKIVNKNSDGEISKQEGTYLSQEFKIKHNEGKIWGMLMGPFGGCFAIRKSLFCPIPSNFLVDDFYECIYVLLKNKQTISDPDALVYEDINHSVADEFQRKVRISTGNFQNLRYFGAQLLNLSLLSRVFISHKLLRWLTPIFLIVCFYSNLMVFGKSTIYQYTLAAQFVLYLSPIINSLFKIVGSKNFLTQSLTHFIIMNMALFVGMLKSFSKINNNIWKPTPRK